jgi:DNA-binding GntR family transcriptional regulator
LLDAIRLKDPVEAARLMREHLDQLESQLRFSTDNAQAPDLTTIFEIPENYPKVSLAA